MSKWLLVIEDGGQPLTELVLLKHAEAIGKDLEAHADGVTVTIRDETGAIVAMRETLDTRPT